MVYKRFSFIISIQVILLASFIALGFWSINQDYLSFTKYGFFILALLQMGYIIYYINKINNDIHKFLQNFVIDDAFPRYRNTFKDGSFKRIEDQLNRIASSYGQVKLEKETEHQFLHHLVEHLDTAIFAISEDEKVLLSNSNAKHLFKKEIKLLSQFNSILDGLDSVIRNLKMGDPEVVRLPEGNFIKPYSLKTTSFTLNRKNIKIVSFNDIDKELVKEELNNWQTLMRILRHEIINSITPITTLAGAMTDNFIDEPVNTELDTAETSLLELSRKGFEAIMKRGKGLLSFVDRFKTISGMPEPVKTEFYISELFKDISVLMQDEFKNYEVEFNYAVSSDELKLYADEKLISHVLINLLKNAIEATETKSEKKVVLSASHAETREVVISVEDNGIGIPHENLEKIFVPFYTTKETGSGIGLSFARLVMHKHGGQLNVNSSKLGAVFSLYIR